MIFNQKLVDKPNVDISTQVMLHLRKISKMQGDKSHHRNHTLTFNEKIGIHKQIGFNDVEPGIIQVVQAIIAHDLNLAADSESVRCALNSMVAESLIYPEVTP